MLTRAQSLSAAPAAGGARHIKRDQDLETLLWVLLFLLGLGLVLLCSASVSLAERSFGDPLFFLKRQLLWCGVGLAGMALLMRLPLRLWQWLGPALLLFGLLGLVAVLLPGLGHEVNGSRRWLRFASFSVQVSEFSKLCLLVYLAGYLVRHRARLRDSAWVCLAPLFLITPLYLVLLLAEPDYGSCVLLFGLTLGLLFIAGAPLARLSAWLCIGGALFGCLLLTSEYRMERLLGFLDPWADPFDSGFQLTQSLIAVGRGGLWGVGLGDGVQKLFYLPEAHTDFSFAVLAEELGFIGCLSVILLYSLLLWKSFAIGRRAVLAGHFFAAWVAYGAGLLLGGQVFLNIGVNLGLLPTKGLPLPLLSYGGSSMLATCLLLGLLLRACLEVRRIPPPGDHA